MNEKKVYQGQYISVAEQVIENTVWEKAYSKNAVIILPINSSGQIYLIKERRPHETPIERWKPVTGFIEEDSTAKENAKRELREELGKNCHRLELIGHIVQTGNYNSEKFIYLASQLYDDKIENPDGDVILDIKEFSLATCLKNFSDGTWPLNFDSFGFFILKNQIEQGRIDWNF